MNEMIGRLTAALADRYRIERELGQGGMATVYLAEDLKHKRRVAVKVLKPELAAVLGAERFVQEITTTAALQHPHILPLFDSGTADGFLFYVMPFIDGETLRDKLDRETQLGVDEAVRIACDVAEALHYAHTHGVIHRDIKPENILLANGRPMVADFGIALAVSAAAGGRMTETGLSLGTPHYMSPEQATAEKEISARSDVYSLGSVLYEMLAGQPPHLGGSAQQIIMKIIAEPVALVTTLRKSVPANVAAALAMALEKLPADRFASAKQFADALVNPAFATTDRTRSGGRGANATDWRARTSATLLVATLAMSVIAAWGWLRPAPHRAARQLVVNLPKLSRIAFPVISPTGERVVFIGDGRLWIRDLAGITSHPLEGTEDAMAPFWSPDGRDLGYWVGNRIFRVSADGGTPALVTELDYACPLDNVCAGSWTDDGRMLLSSGFSAIYEVAEGGGPPRPYLLPDSAEHFHRVAALPGGRGAIFEVDPDQGDNRIDAWDGRTRRTLVEGGALSQYVEPGHLLFRRNGGIWALALRGAEADGAPFLVVDAALGASASTDGALLYRVAGEADAEIVWVDRDGVVRGTVGSQDGFARHPALSPDERRIAFDGKEGIRIHAPERGVRMPLGSPDRVQGRPAWSAGGDQIYYNSGSGTDDEGLAIRVVRAEGGQPETVVDSAFDPWVTRDGRYLTYTTGDNESSRVWYRHLRAPNATSHRFPAGEGSALDLKLSPDARFAAYLAGNATTGRFEVYLSRFPGGEDRIQLSSGGVRHQTRVHWSVAGDQILYVRESDGALMAVDVALGAQVRLSAPRVLFREVRSGLVLSAGVAVSRDPARFLAVRRVAAQEGEAGAVVLMDDWIARAKRRSRP